MECRGEKKKITKRLQVEKYVTSLFEYFLTVHVCLLYAVRGLVFSSLVHEFDDKTVFGFLIFFEKLRVSDVWSYTKLIVKYTQYTLH